MADQAVLFDSKSADASRHIEATYENNVQFVGTKTWSIDAADQLVTDTGKNIRFIGVTGHRSPEVLAIAVERWPVDAVMLPVNPVEGLLGGFLTETLPAARAKGVAVIAMKVLGASHHLDPGLGITAERLIRYALAQGVTLAIVGCSSPLEVKTLVDAACDPRPVPPEEIAALHDLFRPRARKLAYYRGVG